MKKFIGIGFVATLSMAGCGGSDSGGITPELGSVLKELTIDDVTQVENSFATDVSYALKSDGTVFILLNSVDGAVPVSGLSGIKKIALSYNDLQFYLDSNGDIYALGTNTSNELGLGHSNEVLVPEKNSLLNNVVDICSGLSFSLAVTATGDVYSWGSGVLGYVKDNSQETPKKIDGLVDIVKVDCGYSHAIALDVNGNVFSWGEGDNGRLGLGDNDDYITPQQITSLSGITQISAGFDYTLVIDSAKKGYGFGNGTKGKLSLGSNFYTDNQVEPAEVTGVDNVVQVSAGMNHSLFLSGSGDVFSSGSNSDSSQLGFGNNNFGEYEITQATKIPGLSQISYVNAGHNNSVFVDNVGKTIATQEQTITYPEPEISTSECGGIVGSWVKTDGTGSFNVTASCAGVISQDSYNTSSVMKTFLSNIQGDGKLMSYTIVKLEMDGQVQIVGRSFNDAVYSVSADKLKFGNYSYTKQ